jgi:hypothetical protein
VDFATLEEQFSLRSDFQPAQAGEFEANRIRVNPGCDGEIVFELALIAVVAQVNAGINCLVSNPAKSSHINVPAGRVATNEVISFTG